jgi:hypothetical protein
MSVIASPVTGEGNTAFLKPGRKALENRKQRIVDVDIPLLPALSHLYRQCPIPEVYIFPTQIEHFPAPQSRMNHGYQDRLERLCRFL